MSEAGLGTVELVLDPPAVIAAVEADRIVWVVARGQSRSRR